MKYFKSYGVLFCFFFVVGILWGKFFYFNKENREVLFPTKSLVLLAEEGFLPSDVLESYAIENNIEIQLLTYKDEEDLEIKLKEHPVDLVAFKSFNAQEIMTELTRLSYKDIKNKESVSVDFKNLSYDPDNQFAIPLFWGVQNNETVEKSLLWIESIGIAKSSKYKKEAHAFVDYTLQPEIAVEVIRYKKVASTNKYVEKEKTIESKWKPSYIRKMSFRNLIYGDRASF